MLKTFWAVWGLASFVMFIALGVWFQNYGEIMLTWGEPWADLYEGVICKLEERDARREAAIQDLKIWWENLIS